MSHEHYDRDGTFVWTTKDGRRIRLPDIEDSHLLNIRGFLNRRLEKLAEEHSVEEHSAEKRPQPQSYEGYVVYSLDASLTHLEVIEFLQDSFSADREHIEQEIARRGL